MIRKWNEKVHKEDVVIHIGDLCLSHSKEAPNTPNNPSPFLLEQLNGKIILVKGNHDTNNRVKSIIESMIIKVGGYRIFVTHNPQYAKEQYPINLCGHVHEKWQFKKLGDNSVIINMSVEQWDYSPMDINEIFKALSRWRKHETDN
jgi:calcineurin-like phosphoesterase family protein